MDAVQQYVKKELKTNINKFVVSGASKRGWTTWLTASQDKRVVAIAPMVIDVLNMPVNIDYQKKVWGDYSVEIEDYVKLGLAQDMSSPEGIDLVTMIDPYSYRKNLIMPKMLMMGTNDQYWPVDAVKNYFDDIPGDNYIHYEPNVGHDIGDGAGTIKALSAFFNISVYGKTYNQCSWEVNSDSTATLLNIKGSAGLREVTLWICESPDLDFRNDGFKGTRVDFSDSESVQVKVDHPLSGYRAFYADLLYPDPVEGTYSLTTRMFVSGKGELFLEKGE
jgi:PhoPQ-activated pathogenicity-related protein